MTGDRPDARELVEAVAHWLTLELAPALDAGLRFQAMVAAQGLAIAAREVALAEEHLALDHEQLAPLIPGSSGPEQVRQALADTIAAGELDHCLAQTAAVLREHVRRKLAIARPGYDE